MIDSRCRTQQVERPQCYKSGKCCSKRCEMGDPLEHAQSSQRQGLCLTLQGENVYSFMYKCEWTAATNWTMCISSVRDVARQIVKCTPRWSAFKPSEIGNGKWPWEPAL
ncbi:uncharacterized protein MEPE_04590 [Melanopsichium pennsylvanicum]|uniref:Uncharacterized protein n=1 Tax=Melanopsichium pennsylvanicum TaxID=63383 RepID=A0AAJ4XQ33_9BASI|nr:uncharacterized protein MEPE_04590 [Melanopsichium pennsylvanicum]